MGRIRYDLIEKALPYIDGKAGEISLGSSRMVCHSGKLYSYGTHYPLLFRVGNLLFVNERGYSATTNIHIAAARGSADHSVKLAGTDTSAENVRYSLQKESEYITENIEKLKRHGTKKEAAMIERLKEIESALNALDGQK